MDVQMFAKIPYDLLGSKIQWLRISPDTKGTGGVFVLLYSDLSQRCLFDYWFEKIDQAKKWAKRYFGICEDDWKSKEDLEQDGIMIIDEK